MHLIVIASDRPDLTPQAPDVRVLRLAGAPAPGDRPVDGLQAIVDQAMTHLCATFPGWLWAWARESGVLPLQTFDGPVSWWWYTPLSEMSPMRSTLIRDLYWLTVLRLVLENAAATRVSWHGDDGELARVADAIVVHAGARFDAETTPFPFARRRSAAVLRRLRSSVRHACLCAALRLLGFGHRVRPAGAVLYSRFPVLWETHSEPWRERMFGDWPATLERRGLPVAYAAVCTASLGALLRHPRHWLNRCRRQQIVLVEALVTAGDILRAHAGIGFAVRYGRWRWAHRRDVVRFDGIEITRLFWRELDANASSPEIPYDVLLASGMRRALDGMPDAPIVCLPFEYQPMERAVWAGVQARVPRTVVGLQTGVYTANQMGFRFPAEQVRIDRHDAATSPLPDVLAAYGELPYRVFADRLGADRVCWAGPVRYPRLSAPVHVDRAAFHAAYNLPQDATCVLVATSTVRAESIPLLEAAFAAAAQSATVFLLLKFHYHLPLHDTVIELAARHRMPRYRIFEAQLDELLTIASAAVCGGSSIGLEAIARDCMPLVFRSAGALIADPMLDVPDAAYFWQTADELGAALGSTLARDAGCLARRAAWPAALRAQLWPLDGQADARLLDFLVQRGVLTGAAA